jgi:tetratricopeptide (TPR) repeat protein
LAFAYNLLASGNFAPDREAYPKAREKALQALEVDRTLAEAHSALGFVKWRFDWDWSAARTAITRGLELDANNPTARRVLGLYLYSAAAFDAAITEMTTAQQVDPLNMLGRWNLARALGAAHRRDAAMMEFTRAREIEPDHPWPHLGIGLALLEQGRSSEAFTELERAERLSKRDPNVISALAWAYVKVGNSTAAEGLLPELERAGNGHASAYHLASVHHALGDRKAALAWLEKAYAARDDMLVYLKVDPMFETFRSDPAVQDLIRRIGIP